MQNIINDRFEFVKTGRLRIQCKYFRLKAILIVIVGLLGVYLSTYIAYECIYKAFGFDSSTQLFAALLIVVVGGIMIILTYTAYHFFTAPEDWRFRADANGLTLQHEQDVIFYAYQDVKYVTFEPLYRFFSKRGYFVTIATKSGTVTYPYLSPFKGARVTPEECPFYVLQHPPVPVARSTPEVQDIDDFFKN